MRSIHRPFRPRIPEVNSQEMCIFGGVLRTMTSGGPGLAGHRSGVLPRREPARTLAVSLRQGMKKTVYKINVNG